MKSGKCSECDPEHLFLSLFIFDSPITCQRYFHDEENRSKSSSKGNGDSDGSRETGFSGKESTIQETDGSHHGEFQENEAGAEEIQQASEEKAKENQYFRLLIIPPCAGQ